MNKIIKFFFVLIIVFSITSSYAGDKEWAIAGKILTGAIGVEILKDVVKHSPKPYIHSTYYSNNHYPSRQKGCSSYSRSRRWVPGYYRTYETTVWVPSKTIKIWVDKSDCRCRHRCRREHGYYRYKTIPGHYEIVQKEYWVDGYWVRY